MFRRIMPLATAVVILVTSPALAQDGWLPHVAYNVKFSDVSDPDEGVSDLEDFDWAGKRILADFYDGSAINGVLAAIAADGASVDTILLGNSFANLDLAAFVELLQDIKGLQTLVLDSVDHTPDQLALLRKAHPKLRVVLSERTAIECINKSYQFAQGGPDLDSIHRFEYPRIDDLWFLEDKHFVVANRFIGINWHPTLLDALPRDALRYFRHLRHLKNVNLSRVQLTDDDLQYLRFLEQLESLNLYKTPITGEGLKHVPGEHLKSLNFYGAENLSTIPFDRFPKLNSLRVTDSGLSAEAFAGIAACQELTVLRASGTGLRARDIDKLLESMRQLEILQIDYTNIPKDDQELERLRAKYPNTKFILLD